MNALDLSTPLKNFINSSNWIFAKTYAKTWPHEYIEQYIDGIITLDEIQSKIDNLLNNPDKEFTPTDLKVHDD